MGTLKAGSGRGRVRWTAMFASLFFACVAVPALAVDSEAPKGSKSSLTATDAPAPLPSDVSELEAKEREYAEWIEGPEATQQREASRTAYADLSANVARDLLLEAFPRQLEALEADPARLISGLKIERTLATYAALISDQRGVRSLLESSVPIQSELGGEGKQPVDLTLRRSGDDYVAENPLTEVRLPSSAERPIRLQSGVEVRLPTGNDHGAETLGEKSLFYPETETATDTLVSPIASGVEVFEQLRSPESPERFRFVVGLPAGATLRASELGGAEVLSSSGGEIGQVRPPNAVDAQGVAVPVKMSVEGASLLLEVPHRSRDLAYPILVDPEFLEEGYVAFNQWAPSLTAEYNLSNSSSLFAQAKGSGHVYPANSYGQWVYTAPGQTTYIAAATFFSNTFTLPENCATEQPTNQPHGYAGLYNTSTGGWASLGIWSGGSSYSSAFQTGWVGGLNVRKAVVGIGAGPASVHHECAISFSVGGVTIQEKDPEAPTIDWVSGASGSWVKDISVTVHVSDPGLGVSGITLSPNGKSPYTSYAGCSGTYTSRCLSTGEAGFGVGYFAEGERSASISAFDPLGASPNSDPNHVSSSYQWTTRLDRTKPEVELEGQLTQAIEEAEEEGEESAEEVPQLRLPVYNLKIDVTDKAPTGNPETEAIARRSGVKDIAVFVDGEEQEVPWTAQGCSGPVYSCPMEETYPVNLGTLEGGPAHKLKVIAEDQVGNEKEREIEFEYIPATGMKDSYVMQYFALPDGEESEEEEEHPARPELAVNVVNGNLVFRQKDVDVEGPSVDLEVERFYNSQLPEEEDTEWGDGWTLAQTPELEPEEVEEEVAPEEAEVLGASGEMETAVGLPTEAEEEQFDPKLQAVVTKEPDGGYAVTDESGETDATLAFDESGKVTELRTAEDATAGEATIEYDYEEGNLSELAVDDPAVTGKTPEEVAELEQLKSSTPAYQSSFGYEGSGNGQFSYPADLVRGSNNHIWVVDQNNNRVEEFNSEGEYVGQFGSYGSGNGQFVWPTAITRDSKGRLWVFDLYNERIQQFNEEGEYIRQIEAYAELWEPISLAVDSEDDLWVANANTLQLEEFDEEGEFIGSVDMTNYYPWVVPSGIAIGPDNHVWVADTNVGRVFELDQEGGELLSFGSYGSGNGQFKHPAGIDVDAKGNVWVVDQGNDRVQGFDEEGEYIAQFGTEGPGAGEFKLGYQAGIAVNSAGDLWATDAGNDRVQKWRIPGYTLEHFSSYEGSVGISGSEPGQFNQPYDLTTTADSHVWVADSFNHRIEEFSPEGEFLSQFGESGSEEGQLNLPVGITTDAEGDLWTANYLNHHVQEFDAEGKLLTQFGEVGSEPGQFKNPTRIAVDSEGDLWISDSGNDRVQKFSPKGEFLEQFGGEGTGPGQFNFPGGIAIDRDGNLWVVDRDNHRLQKFSPEGEFLEQVGEEGTGPGQFKVPTGVAVDLLGNVWVADQNNHRIQEFSPDGGYLTQIGEEGEGEGQLKNPGGLSFALDGRVWIADRGNNRIEEWQAFSYTPPEGGERDDEDDPVVNFDTSEGLVDAVEGEEAGQITYGHEGEMLTSVNGPQGETEYDYDAEERLAKVTLANGTWGEVKYDEAGRVKSVKVYDATTEDPAKTTYFIYKEEPRRTTVNPEGEPTTVYDIGPDGSVLKWWNTETPPEIQVISGSLYQNKETAEPIEPGDYELEVLGNSVEGIASIDIVANGSQLVSEKTCQQDYETEEVECKAVEDLWVTNTGDWPPGILNLEVVVAGENGNIETARFWVNIPYTPPPDPEADEPPRFGKVLDFREEYGLDLDIKGDEKAIAERIFNLIGDWYNPHTPSGEVARATDASWGVPLRAVDAAELEYRDVYLEQAAPIIEAYGVENSTDYAGYYVDHSQGGIIHLGFVSNGSAHLEDLGSDLIAPESRVQLFPATPTRSLATLEAQELAISNDAETDSQLQQIITSIYLDASENKVVIGTEAMGSMQEYVASHYETGAVSIKETDPPPPLPVGQFKRKDTSGPIQAGDEITTPIGENLVFRCTAAYGSFDKVRGARRFFLLTAGHCFSNGAKIYQGNGGRYIGKVSRHKYDDSSPPVNDAAAFLLKDGISRPHFIFQSRSRQVRVKPPLTKFYSGQSVCQSGLTSGVRCGPVLNEGKPLLMFALGSTGERIQQRLIPVRVKVSRGDSGGPIFDARSHRPLGITSFASSGTSDSSSPLYEIRTCIELGGGQYNCPVIGVKPLRTISKPGHGTAVGLLNTLGVNFAR